MVVTRPLTSLTLPGQYAAATVDLSGVDWASEFVLVADMGEQRTGGYGVEPVGVQRRGDRVEVVLAVYRPRPGSMAVQAFTHPWCLVRIPRSGLPPRVSVVVRDQDGRELAELTAALDGAGP